MALNFELIDPPSIGKQESYQVESLAGSKTLQTFVPFHWHGQVFWVLGKAVWKNVMNAGDVLLRLPKGRNHYAASLRVRHWEKPLTFSVSYPRIRQSTQHKTFVFVGFCPKRLVSIEFVRAENDRLSALPRDYASYLQEKISKPRVGHIV